jgi:hypothetical protein
LAGPLTVPSWVEGGGPTPTRVDRRYETRRIDMQALLNHLGITTRTAAA